MIDMTLAMHAQMSAAYVVAVQFTDSDVLPKSYGPDKIGRKELKCFIDKTKCIVAPGYADLTATMTVTLEDGKEYVNTVKQPRGSDPLLTPEEIVEKFDGLTQDIVEPDRLVAIKDIVLNAEAQASIDELVKNLQGLTKSVL